MVRWSVACHLNWQGCWVFSASTKFLEPWDHSGWRTADQCGQVLKKCSFQLVICMFLRFSGWNKLASWSSMSPLLSWFFTYWCSDLERLQRFYSAYKRYALKEVKRQWEMPWLLWSCQEQVSCLQCPNLQHWNDVASVRCRARQRTLILTGQYLTLAAHGQKEAASSCRCEPLFQLKLEVDAHLCDLVCIHLMHQGPNPCFKICL